MNNNKPKEYHIVNGVITSINDNNLIIKDINSNSFYSVTTSTLSYTIGDTIAVYSKDAVIETYPAQVKASKIEILEKNKNEEVTMLNIPVANREIKENEQIKESDIIYKSVPKNSIENDPNIITNKDDIIGKYVYKGKTVYKDYFFYLDDITNTKTTSNSNSNNTNTNPNSNSNNNNNSNTNNNINETKTEADVVNYFTTLNNNLDKNDTSTSFAESLKSGFVTVVDFLFYNGEIYGYTFKELTNSAKQQVLKLALWIDSKIEIVLPGYKETLSSAYTSVKNKVISAYLDLTTKICTNDPNLCEQAKSDFSQMKESFSLTWNFLKDLVGSGIDKLSEWYLIWKET